MTATYYFSNITYALGGLFIFLVVIFLAIIAAKSAEPKKRTKKDDIDDITFGGFSQMLDDDH
jgi:hypothetical protein